MHLIIADDHSLMRNALAELIMRQEPGWTVTEAETLDEVLDLIRLMTVTPDIALLDYKMPGMAGLAGIARLRRRFPEVIPVLLSGVAQREDVDAALAAGARGFIPKSLAPDRLLRILRLIAEGECIVAGPYGRRNQARFIRMLRARERTLLGLLLDGYDMAGMAARLGCEELGLRKELSALYNRIGARNRTEALRIATEL